MLHAEPTLTATELAEVAALEHVVVAHDGGRLKLEWGTLRSRTDGQVDDLAWREEGRLVGFAGLYGFGGSDLELAGMVDPQARRRGVGTALLRAGCDLAAGRGREHLLLVTPRSGAGGTELAAAHGGILDHSEHAMVLTALCPGRPDDTDTVLRPAVAGDVPALRHVFAAAFGAEHSDVGELDSGRARLWAVERDGEVVGALRVDTGDGSAGLFGFGILPEQQGRGVGRDVLRRACRQALADGATSVRLEVAVDNESALGLYTSVGFSRVQTEDYFRIPCPLPGPAPTAP